MFKATDGEKYQYDVWYPLPFIVGNKTMLPTMKESDLALLVVSDKRGIECRWGPFTRSADFDFWMVRRSGHFEI